MNTSITDHQLKHNYNIPGWANESILTVLGTCASKVEEHGVIVELGGLFGRSTYTLGHNKKESVELITIDVWPTMTYHEFHDGKCGANELAMLTSKLHGDPLIISGDDFYALWAEFTKDIQNLKSIKANVSTFPMDHFPMIDFLYHDAGHSYEDVYGDLKIWLHKIKPKGIIIVDDYDSVNFPGVIQAVNQIVSENKLVTEMVTERNILLHRGLM
jgi:hypothetical protein